MIWMTALWMVLALLFLVMQDGWGFILFGALAALFLVADILGLLTGTLT